MSSRGRRAEASASAERFRTTRTLKHALYVYDSTRTLKHALYVYDSRRTLKRALYAVAANRFR